MVVIKSFGYGCSICLIIFFCPLPTRVLAQTAQPAPASQADRDQTLQALLAEVHELRVAIERATVTNTRFQMLIERLKAQQIQVDLLRGKLGSVRSELGRLRAEKELAAAVVKDQEDRLTQTSGEERTAIETSLKERKREMESKVAGEQQQLTLEADLLMRLQTEDARLTELNGQLDLLLKQLKIP